MIGPRNAASIRQALVALLEGAPPGEAGGFVIFQGKSDLDYVQYAPGSNGLLLNWPTFQEGGEQRLPCFEASLARKGYSRIMPSDDGIPLPEQIGALRRGQYMILEDGLYCQVGRDAEEVTILTAYLLSSVFGITDKDAVSITLEPD